MSIIKEIYDVAKDGITLTTQRTAIKRALRTELKLNRKFLLDIEEDNEIDNIRRIEIVQMLEIIELASAVKYEIPYMAISSRQVTAELANNLKIKRLKGAGIEQIIETLYLLISYLKKDYKNKRISLNLRLINIYKYNKALLELLN